MLHRQDAEGLVLISQPAHAWVSGQLARQWGRNEFRSVREEVCLAAEQHDLGFLHWEQFPTLNPATGLPHSFLELPRQMHLEIWTTSVQQMLRFGRYPALLVSLHFSMLARRKELGDSPGDRHVVDAFLEQQEALQTTLRVSLTNDFCYGPLLSDASLRHHQELVSAWDWISLLLCHGLTDPRVVENIPTAKDRASLRLIPAEHDSSQVRVEPWPFSSSEVRLICEGRRLLKTYTDENQMREGLKAAAPVTVITRLVAG